MTYTVQGGDTLYKIAQKMYGDGNVYPIIAQANGIKNVDLIQVGQNLTIPGEEAYPAFTPTEVIKMGLPPFKIPSSNMLPAPTKTPTVLPSTYPMPEMPSTSGMMKWALIGGAAILGFFIIKTVMDKKNPHDDDEEVDQSEIETKEIVVE